MLQCRQLSHIWTRMERTRDIHRDVGGESPAFESARSAYTRVIAPEDAGATTANTTQQAPTTWWALRSDIGAGNGNRRRRRRAGHQTNPGSH
jgi:hypothetical protein